jgi:hypothetical protein
MFHKSATNLRKVLWRVSDLGSGFRMSRRPPAFMIPIAVVLVLLVVVVATDAPPGAK